MSKCQTASAIISRNGGVAGRDQLTVEEAAARVAADASQEQRWRV